MAFFNNMKGKITQTGSSTVQKAKDLSETARLNRLIAEEEKQISELYGKIGYEVYRAYRENPLPEVAELMEKVTQMHSYIAGFREQIQIINNIKTCPNCNAEITKGMSFCSECGSRIESSENENPSEVSLHCSECGAPVPEGSVFCSSCGKKLE